jgi:general stress protein 26
MATATASNVEKLRELIKGIKIAMLTTTDEHGRLYSRPMATQEADFDGDLWFFASDDAPKSQEIQNHPNVNVAYSDNNRFVSVSGKAQIVKDRTRMKEFWSPIYKAWFPDGLESPHLCLLKVSVEQAEYWEGPGGVVARLTEFVKAATGGKTNMGENEKLNLR